MENTLLTLLKRTLISWTGNFISDFLTFLVILLNIKRVRDITLAVKPPFFSSLSLSYFLNCFYGSKTGEWEVKSLTYYTWLINICLFLYYSRKMKLAQAVSQLTTNFIYFSLGRPKGNLCIIKSKRLEAICKGKTLPSGFDSMGLADIVQLEKEENWHQVLAKGLPDLLQIPTTCIQHVNTYC